MILLIGFELLKLWHKLKSKHLEILANDMKIQPKLILAEGSKVMEALMKKLDNRVDQFNKKFVGVKTADSIAKEIQERMDHLKKNVLT